MKYLKRTTMFEVVELDEKPEPYVYEFTDGVTRLIEFQECEEVEQSKGSAIED